MKKIEISCMKDTFDKGFNAAKTTVGKGYEAAKTTVSKGYEAAKTTVGKGYEAAKTSVGKGYMAAKTTVDKGCQSAKGTVDKGITAAKDTIDDVASIRVKSKCDCDFRITSAKKDKDLFHCGFAFDRDTQLLKIAGIALAVVSVGVTAAVVAGCLKKDAAEAEKNK